MKMYNHSIRLIVACLLIIMGHSRAELCVNLDSTDMRLLSTHEMRFCYISFVMIDGQKYLVKQKKSICQRKLMGVVRDALMAHFAEDFINAHKVAVIPAGKAFLGKPRTDWPATLHTVAPGSMIKAQKSRYTHMDIKQADKGFRREMLSWMDQHEMILLIVAYDTFFCNHDRHRGNLFYKPQDNSFCAIDMDSAYKHNLCALACKYFVGMLNKSSKSSFSDKEIRVLIRYKDLLKLLIKKYNPTLILQMYDYFAQQAGLVPGAACFLPKFVPEIENNKKIIRQSYLDVNRLVQIIEQLLEKAKKRKKYRTYAVKS